MICGDCSLLFSRAVVRSRIDKQTRFSEALLSRMRVAKRATEFSNDGAFRMEHFRRFPKLHRRTEFVGRIIGKGYSILSTIMLYRSTIYYRIDIVYRFQKSCKKIIKFIYFTLLLERYYFIDIKAKNCIGRKILLFYLKANYYRYIKYHIYICRR